MKTTHVDYPFKALPDVSENIRMSLIVVHRTRDELRIRELAKIIVRINAEKPHQKEDENNKKPKETKFKSNKMILFLSSTQKPFEMV